MQLSTRCRYALRAMIDLALHHGAAPVKRQDIAVRQGVPEAYLVQLFVTLRNHGLVKTLRGPSGGHLLGREPRDITMKQVVDAFEGESSSPPTEERTAADAPIDQVWRRAEAARDSMLSEVSLADLVQLYQSSTTPTMFHI